MPPAFIYHPECDWHETGPGHPENGARTRRIVERVRESDLSTRLRLLQPELAPAAAIESVHVAEYHRFIEEACLSGARMVDSGDTIVGEDSYRAALLSAGGVMLGVDEVAQGQSTSAFVATRPPGHHATQTKAMGFCLFNNVAIAARHAQRSHGLQRVLIVDWDVHHGNGTQDIFYEDPSVLFFSIHQQPLYPGTGAVSETGRGKGEGLTINCPVPARTTFEGYERAFKEVLIPAAERFKPQIILVSAGFDAHEQDPLADVCLQNEDYGRLAGMVLELADRHCGGKAVFALEGGYDIDALTGSVMCVLRAMCEHERRPPASPEILNPQS